MFLGKILLSSVILIEYGNCQPVVNQSAEVVAEETYFTLYGGDCITQFYHLKSDYEFTVLADGLDYYFEMVKGKKNYFLFPDSEETALFKLNLRNFEITCVKKVDSKSTPFEKFVNNREKFVNNRGETQRCHMKLKSVDTQTPESRKSFFDFVGKEIIPVTLFITFRPDACMQKELGITADAKFSIILREDVDKFRFDLIQRTNGQYMLQQNDINPTYYLNTKDFFIYSKFVGEVDGVEEVQVRFLNGCSLIYWDSKPLNDDLVAEKHKELKQKAKGGLKVVSDKLVIQIDRKYVKLYNYFIIKPLTTRIGNFKVNHDVFLIKAKYDMDIIKGYIRRGKDSMLYFMQDQKQDDTHKILYIRGRLHITSIDGFELIKTKQIRKVRLTEHVKTWLKDQIQFALPEDNIKTKKTFKILSSRKIVQYEKTEKRIVEYPINQDNVFEIETYKGEDYIFCKIIAKNNEITFSRNNSEWTFEIILSEQQDFLKLVSKDGFNVYTLETVHKSNIAVERHKT